MVILFLIIKKIILYMQINIFLSHNTHIQPLMVNTNCLFDLLVIKKCDSSIDKILIYNTENNVV